MASLLERPFTPSLSIAIPSITIRGSLDAFSEEPPRIRIWAPLPGAPSLLVTLTPAIFPEIISCAFITKPLFFPSGFMAVTEPVRSFFLATP